MSKTEKWSQFSLDSKLFGSQGELANILQAASRRFLKLLVLWADGFEQKRHHATLMHCDAVLRVNGQPLQGHCRGSMHFWTLADHVADNGCYGAKATQLLGICTVRSAAGDGRGQILSQQVVRRGNCAKKNFTKNSSARGCTTRNLRKKWFMAKMYPSQRATV